MSTGGVEQSRHPDISLFPMDHQSQVANQCVLQCRTDLSETPFRTCMRCLLLCLGAPPCVNAACANIRFKKSKALRWVGAFAACFLWLPRASLVSYSVSCVLAAVGCSGLVRATKLVKLAEIAHTSWRISIVFFVYNVLTLLWGTPLLPRLTLVHPPRVSLTW